MDPTAPTPVIDLDTITPEDLYDAVMTTLAGINSGHAPHGAILTGCSYLADVGDPCLLLVPAPPTPDPQPGVVTLLTFAITVPQDRPGALDRRDDIIRHLAVLGIRLSALHGTDTSLADAGTPTLGDVLTGQADPGMVTAVDRVTGTDLAAEAIEERIDAARAAHAARRQFTPGQPVMFRDRSRGAELEPGTFIRYEDESGHPREAARTGVLVEDASGRKIRTSADRVEPACLCQGREGHTNPACPWYGSDQ